MDEVATKELKKFFRPYIQEIDNQGVLDDYECLDGYVLIPIDGTGYFSSKEIHCDQCLEKHHKDGTITYHHSALGACIVAPGQSEVFPVGIEDIAKQDGQTKNDCELNAGKRFIPQIVEVLGQRKFILGGDAIYANGPIIRLISEQKQDIKFIFNVKPGSQAYLFLQFERLEQQGKVQVFSTQSGNKKYITKYANNLILNGENQDILVNFIHFEEHDLKKGTVKIFDWITDFTITSKNFVKITHAGRARWKIENETFNTLKKSRISIRA